MGSVKVEVTNKSGQKVGLLLDEDDERVEYLKKLVKRDELEDVKVSPYEETKAKAATSATPAKKAAAKKAAVKDKEPATPATPPAGPADPADKK